MTATPKPFSALIGAMNTPTRASAAPPRRNAVAPVSPAARQYPIGRLPDQRPESGQSVAEYYARKQARGEHGSFDAIRLNTKGYRQ